MKKSTRRGFVYFRYIMPILMAVCLIVLMFIPCYRFITADTGVNQAISLSELLDNSWDTSREYMFGNGEKNDVTLDFARTLFIVVIMMWVLFAIGVLFAIYSAVIAFRYILSGCVESKSRILYVTLTVNRVVLCVYYALMIPIFMLPKIMPYLYDNMLNYHIELSTSPFDMLWASLGVFAATAIIIAISKRFEVLAQINVYSSHTELLDEEEEYIEEDDTPKDIYESMSERAKAEQAERIMRLLNKHGSGEEDR